MVNIHRAVKKLKEASYFIILATTSIPSGNDICTFQVVPWILVLIFFHELIFKFMVFKLHFALFV